MQILKIKKKFKSVGFNFIIDWTILGILFLFRPPDSKSLKNF